MKKNNNMQAIFPLKKQKTASLHYHRKLFLLSASGSDTQGKRLEIYA